MISQSVSLPLAVEGPTYAETTATGLLPMAGRAVTNHPEYQPDRSRWCGTKWGWAFRIKRRDAAHHAGLAT
jgi:hypothetical protein